MCIYIYVCMYVMCQTRNILFNAVFPQRHSCTRGTLPNRADLAAALGPLSRASLRKLLKEKEPFPAAVRFGMWRERVESSNKGSALIRGLPHLVTVSAAVSKG